MIRQEYKEQLQEHREGNPGWGSSAIRNAGDHIVRYLNKHESIVSVLDYGCGNGVLADWVQARVDRQLEWYEYDPSVPGKDQLPDSGPGDLFDLIISVDVLEHVEPGSIEATLEWIADNAVRQFHHIDCNETKDRLPDGRDVHLLVRPPDWWDKMLVGRGFTRMYRADIHQRKRGRYPRTSCTFILER